MILQLGSSLLFLRVFPILLAPSTHYRKTQNVIGLLTGHLSMDNSKQGRSLKGGPKER